MNINTDAIASDNILANHVVAELARLSNQAGDRRMNLINLRMRSKMLFDILRSGKEIDSHNKYRKMRVANPVFDSIEALTENITTGSEPTVVLKKAQQPKRKSK